MAHIFLLAIYVVWTFVGFDRALEEGLYRRFPSARNLWAFGANPAFWLMWFAASRG